MTTSTISIGRIQSTLPKKLYLGSESPQCPKGTRLVLVNADPSNSQHFYFCTRKGNKTEGVLATYDLCYIIVRPPTLEAYPGFRYQESPLPHFVNDAEYPCWVTDDMLLILEEDHSCKSTYLFRYKCQPNQVFSCFADEVGARIILEEYQCRGDTRKQRFTLQNKPC